MVPNNPDTPLPVRTHLALQDLLPPAGYTEPIVPSPPLGAFALLLDESTPEVIGRVLGSDASADRPLASPGGRRGRVRGDQDERHAAPHRPPTRVEGHHRP